MNERIKLLAEQAGAGWDDKYHWYVGSVAMEKFAKLIVKECCEVAHCNFHVDGLTLGQILREHFGVE